MASQLAALEATLARPAGVAPAVTVQVPAASRDENLGFASTGSTMFHSSSYFRALEPVDLAALGTANTESIDTLTAATSSAEHARPRPAARRGLYLGLGGVAIAAAVAGAFGILAHRGGDERVAAVEPPRPPATIPAPATIPPPAPLPAPAPAPPPTPTPTPPTTPTPEPSAPAEPAPRPAPTARKPPPAPRGPAAAAVAAAAPSSEAAIHLRNAEDARRASKTLTQLAEANLALTAEPRNVRAQFLVGDALLRSGDTDRGCAYLKPIKRLAAAKARAHDAGCPDD